MYLDNSVFAQARNHRNDYDILKSPANYVVIS
jgi:hypothetical protein